MKPPTNNTLLQSGFPPEFLETLRNLIAYFIIRQKLVMVAMVEVNPRGLYNITRINVRPYIATHYKKMQTRIDARKKAQEHGEKLTLPKQIWKGDWEYYAHGRGCRLIHIRTGERIEWDASEYDDCDLFWFLNHLEWRLDNEADDHYVNLCKTWMETNNANRYILEKAINRMIDFGILDVNRGNKVMFAQQKPQPYTTLTIPANVMSAYINALKHYHERQHLAIQAMVDIYPNPIFQVINDPYALSETKQQLSNLIKNASPSKPSPKNVQKGIWQDKWNYKIYRAGTCNLTHIETNEPISWAVDNPLRIDESGSTFHIAWRIETNDNDSNIDAIRNWMNDNVNNTNIPGGLYGFTQQALTEKQIILRRCIMNYSLQFNDT